MFFRQSRCRSTIATSNICDSRWSVCRDTSTKNLELDLSEIDVLRRRLRGGVPRSPVVPVLPDLVSIHMQSHPIEGSLGQYQERDPAARTLSRESSVG